MNTRKDNPPLLLLLFIGVLFSCQINNKNDRNTENVENLETAPITLVELDLSQEYTDPIPKYPDEGVRMEYIPLETTQGSLLDRNYQLRHVDDEYIIVTNGSRGEVLFFRRNGKFITSFACKGGGPKEIRSHISDCFWDSQNKEIYLNDTPSARKIVVFDEKGNYQRTLSIESSFEIHHIADFDESSFLAYDQKNMFTQNPIELEQANPFPYILLSKQDGKKIGQLPFRVSPRVSSVHFQSPTMSTKIPTVPFRKMRDEFLITDIGLDTIYKYSSKTKEVIPVFTKTPELQSQPLPKTLIALGNYNDKYVTFHKFVNTVDFEKNEIGVNSFFIYDQQNKSFHSQKFKYRREKNNVPSGYNINNTTVLPPNTSYGMVSAESLQTCFENGELTDPRLIEIATSLGPESNDILELTHYNP